MQQMKILVVEDDPTQADNIMEILAEFGYAVCEPAYNSIMALHLFKTASPDLALVDINLENSPMDGIQLVEQFNKIRRIPIIFLSGEYDRTTRNRAKKVNPNHFIIKPYHPKQIETSIDFALHDFMKSKGQENVIDDFYTPDTVRPSYVFIKHHTRYTRINLGDILYMKADGMITHIYLTHRSYAISTNLSDLLEKLNSDFFILTHRSYAVNIHAILAFDATDAIIIRNQEEIPIPIANAKRDNFLEKFKIIRTK